jgi:hypothetical protein
MLGKHAVRDAQGRLHIVDVEYLDDCRFPEAEHLLLVVEANGAEKKKTVGDLLGFSAAAIDFENDSSRKSLSCGYF